MKLSNLLSELRNTTKPKEKQAVLLSYDSRQLRELLKWTYDPFILFNVTIKAEDLPAPADHDLGEIFDDVTILMDFCQSSKSPKQNRERVNKLMRELDSGSQELLMLTLNKSWKSGISGKTVNKSFPGLIKQFNVQLSETYDPNKESHKRASYGLSYKLDGLRCVALREKDSPIWKLCSRKGNEFLTVEHLKPQLETIYKATGWTFFDGELYKHGLKFEEIQGPVMAYTKGQVPDMEYHVFAVGDATKFLAGLEPEHVIIPWGTIGPRPTQIESVEMGRIGPEDIEENLVAAFEQGYEGLMLRNPSMPYAYKRSADLLKLKKSLSSDDEGEIISDCTVLGIEYNDAFPVVEDGEMKTERLLNRILVMQPDDVECHVGSGFDLDFRRYYTEHPEELIDLPVEIKHQGWGANGRMRFPRLWRPRYDL